MTSVRSIKFRLCEYSDIRHGISPVRVGLLNYLFGNKVQEARKIEKKRGRDGRNAQLVRLTPPPTTPSPLSPIHLRTSR